MFLGRSININKRQTSISKHRLLQHLQFFRMGLWFMQLHLKLVVIILVRHFVVANCVSSMLQQPWRHDDERSALLQFKESFVIDKSMKVLIPSFLRVKAATAAHGMASSVMKKLVM